MLVLQSKSAKAKRLGKTNKLLRARLLAFVLLVISLCATFSIYFSIRSTSPTWLRLKGGSVQGATSIDIPRILDEASRQIKDGEQEVDLRKLGKWELNPEFGDIKRRAGPHFDWEALADIKHPNFTSWVVRYVDLLRPLLTRDPQSTKPLTLSRPSNRSLKWNCLDNMYMSGPRPTPARIVDLFLFAYEFDVLEMRLYELDPLVDVFVIVETTKSFRNWDKPIMLGAVLDSPRFKRFRHKIVYSVLDDSGRLRYERHRPAFEDEFSFQRFSRAYLMDKYVEAFGTDNGSTLFIHGDIDEMPSAEQVAAFKYCLPRQHSLPVILPTRFVAQNFAWGKLPPGDIQEAPMIFDIKARGKYSAGLPRPSPSVWGWTLDEPMIGAHMSYFTPVEGDILKYLSFSGGGKLPRSRYDRVTAIALAQNPSMGLVFKMCGIRVCCPIDPKYTEKLEQPTFIPWFADANRHRFPQLFPSSQALNVCDYIRGQQDNNRPAFDRALSWAYSRAIRLKSIHDNAHL
ncbi:Beta-1,4-mannosyl-glycoprotein 4-beta-N-acetylglucosaminyltransferase [Perkinsus chesapeaki]|uniref:Beta-1,4-mannosyl-glycoprotein 4-beta-N-acetylglucosaminyltransferase n=1 Tax=Perkinsus chesapeaki TaxID=330153 RepID=A0A7J6L9K9_PERCH|nr:Beta-1,4-mannosyl-glycoprotein 4-beta-N-acetylglucosaminyltransferase [Perkinsus chesapeaki]